VASRLREGILPLYSALESCVQLQSPQHKRDMDLLEWVQEGHKNDQGDGTPLLKEKAERVGVVWPGEEKAPGKPSCSLSVLKGGL